MIDWQRILTDVIISVAAGVGTFLLSGKALFQHMSNKAFERYRTRIQLETDRITRIHEREFSVLPDLWQRVVNFRRTYMYFMADHSLRVDLNTFSNEAYGLFVNEQQLPDLEKARLMSAKNRNEMYVQVIEGDGFNILNRMYVEFGNAFSANRIFLTDGIESVLKELNSFFFTSMNLYVNGIVKDMTTRKIFLNDFENTSTRLLDDLHSLIKGRLRFEESS